LQKKLIPEAMSRSWDIEELVGLLRVVAPHFGQPLADHRFFACSVKVSPAGVWIHWLLAGEHPASLHLFSGE
jgi:hypothetical protein